MSELSCCHTEANDTQPATTQCAQRGAGLLFNAKPSEAGLR